MTLKKGRGESNKKLWLRLRSELKTAEITEAYVSADDVYVDGLCHADGSVVINPQHQTVDTVIHELLHRIYPERSERSIRRTTTILRKTLTDKEVQEFYEEYRRRRKKGKPRSADI